MSGMANEERDRRILGRRVQGLYAEDLALEWLIAQGYQLLKRNLRQPRIGEVDLVLLRKDLLHVVEVKSIGPNVRNRKADPLLYISQSQLKRMLRVLDLWFARCGVLAALPEWSGLSIDVVTVDQRHRPPRIRHFENVLPPEIGLPGF